VAAPDGSGRLRTGDRMLLAGASRVDGYAGLEPAKRLDYRTPAAWRQAGAGWALVPATDARSGQRRWMSVRDMAPRARLVTTIQKGEKSIDTETLGLHAAVVDPPVALADSTPGSAQVVLDEPGDMTIETSAPARQLLVTTESFESNWRVAVDGRPQAIVRVNGDFLGCVVEAGKHLVRFELRPRCRELGMIVSLCGLGLMGLVFCFRSLGFQPWRAHKEPACRDRL